MTAAEGKAEAVQPADEPEALRRHLGLLPAAGLAVTTVIGGGALVLPGVAVRAAGPAAIWGWLLAAAVTIPLLVIFAQFGARHPTAGGIAGFVAAAWGRRAAAGTAVVLMGTVALGMPAIALSGGSYLCTALGWPTSWSWTGAIGLILLGAAVLLGGGRVSAVVQVVLAAALTAGLAAAGIAGLSGDGSQLVVPAMTATTLEAAVSVVGVVFFAFTGWEVVAFTTAEYRDPRRDFPRALAISYLVVVGVYLLVALGVQATVDPGDPAAATAPVAAVVQQAVSPQAAVLTAALGAAILAANLIGAMWGASRLAYAGAVAGLLPARVATLRGPQRTPAAAVLITAATFCVSVCWETLGLLSTSTMLLIAGENFFLLSMLTAAAYVRVSRRRSARTFGVVVTVGLGVVAVAGFPWVVFGYAAALFAVGWMLAGRNNRSTAS